MERKDRFIHTGLKLYVEQRGKTQNTYYSKKSPILEQCNRQKPIHAIRHLSNSHQGGGTGRGWHSLDVDKKGLLMCWKYSNPGLECSTTELHPSLWFLRQYLAMYACLSVSASRGIDYRHEPPPPTPVLDWGERGVLATMVISICKN